ncbi:MAG: hypothetical protein Q6K55_10680 [Thermostichus sp. DG02_3_bins_51]
MWKRLRGGLLLVLGFMLSPLSWWNDLFFNLPIAYGFGYLCSLWQPDWLLGGTLVGYWISNLLGILMMQIGATDVVENEQKPRSLKRNILIGLASSTVYTLVILGLVEFRIVDISAIFPFV